MWCKIFKLFWEFVCFKSGEIKVRGKVFLVSLIMFWWVLFIFNFIFLNFCFKWFFFVVIFFFFEINFFMVFFCFFWDFFNCLFNLVNFFVVIFKLVFCWWSFCLIFFKFVIFLVLVICFFFWVIKIFKFVVRCFVNFNFNNDWIVFIINGGGIFSLVNFFICFLLKRNRLEIFKGKRFFIYLF